MKTRNNVQKAVLRTGAVIVSLVLISYTVSAQEFWKRLLANSSFGDIALAMADADYSKGEANHENAGFFQFATELEPELEVESWMTDDSRFSTATFSIETATDTPLELEPWMMDENLFEPAEKALELEDWMTSEAVWGI
ncbi:hypothetical protein [Maribellus sp. YY47]|uniref:hypothetical protein n=1 Tax=Maribellus sp. YY47 TaxID=2929486 RepID=UPI002000E5EF|nr:hypothetical protein [Maribellus sp. YY47]MCK3685951.1 hypothetical protein [Maribellus sp. YY47]